MHMRNNYPKPKNRGHIERRLLTIIFCIWLIIIVALLAFWHFHAAFMETNPVLTDTHAAAKELPAGDHYQPTDTNTPWNLTLVNRWNAVPAQYAMHLVDIPGGEKVDARIYKPLMHMLSAAEAENLGPIVVSGYRTQQEQQRLYDDKVREYQKNGYGEKQAKELAQEWVALPGYSEHHLGFAVDINGATYDIYLWLQENSYKYGFIFRYPGSKTALTGGAEEVWHYRYVGVKAATEIYEQGVCLEEYLEHLTQ